MLFLLAACFDEESSWSAADTCPADGYNVYGMPNRGTFVDERDGQVYKYTTIGDQVWMAQNLNYASEYSTTNDSLKDCAECGLWYGLAKSSLNGRDFIDTICPAGWKVPTEEEWEKMISLVGGESKAMKILATENWSTSFQGTNECGFNAIASGKVIIDDYSSFYQGGGIFGGHKGLRALDLWNVLNIIANLLGGGGLYLGGALADFTTPSVA